MSGIKLNLKLQVRAYPPVTAEGYLPDIKNVCAIIFQNVGDSTVRLFNNMYTVLPNGGVLTLNATETPMDGVATMDLLQLMVTFTGGATNRLEYLVIRPSNDNYTLPC